MPKIGQLKGATKVHLLVFEDGNRKKIFQVIVPGGQFGSKNLILMIRIFEIYCSQGMILNSCDPPHPLTFAVLTCTFRAFHLLQSFRYGGTYGNMGPSYRKYLFFVICFDYGGSIRVRMIHWQRFAALFASAGYFI